MTERLTHINKVPVIGICAYSGTGKTTLLSALIPWLKNKGINVAVIKHAHHQFDLDKPGKDSFVLRQSGAQQVLIASSRRYAHLVERQVDSPIQLQPLLAQIDTRTVQLILVEGFKHHPISKIELHRASCKQPLIYPNDHSVMAIACCKQTQIDTELTRLDIDDIEQIGDFILSLIQTRDRSLPTASNCGPFDRDSKSVEDALSLILSHTNAVVNTQVMAVEHCLDNVLAKTVVAPINVPQHTNSAMDGYAFNASALLARGGRIAKLEVVDKVMAGDVFDDELAPGQALSIMTGAPLPAGADTVVAREWVVKHGCYIDINTEIKVGQNVRQCGEDIKLNQTVLAKGERLNASKLALLASLGIAQLTVYCPPKVAVFSTGNEITEPGEQLKKAAVYDANRFALKAMLQRLNCEVIDLGILPDSAEQISSALQTASAQADVIVTSAGVSMGEADYVKTCLAQLGDIVFSQVQMRPGRPLVFGSLNRSLVFALPGNPVASMICFILFVAPAVRKLSAQTTWQPKVLTARATSQMNSRVGRSEYLRGICRVGDDGQMHVSLTGRQGSGVLSSMVQANCLIAIPADTADVSVGDQVSVILLSEFV
ncbi:bifunctional molybdopterin-guanine dinucleotide biosynthesis adaptor protein MobB/molybdopterin molybdotransferase MoeA [Thalassotalea ponticola]|uniref:bifunctional molybdopterin-guanine dinucleotide biosynthesis adaptor protein MobB/molybdopterin molybdotransferase MoeA n=1 Tax=Thalassotalea ponticola TaxID=1523392 RepID=UPI0025B555A5|nr:bifunctional molybdopterin-guanine dinucleotide biosynthesis adaptor protein MobB/molybdopterin molybdotransferase MoeA [Thalassotalea ponticola]MDN3653972.1 bifunctional molybdopterin-guanine dinucleotide biosynthesis adaptor protein MobB/molybdopterin molybdotransferase MoeA [Thalassotalea ponticola]